MSQFDVSLTLIYSWKWGSLTIMSHVSQVENISSKQVTMSWEHIWAFSATELCWLAHLSVPLPLAIWLNTICLCGKYLNLQSNSSTVCFQCFGVSQTKIDVKFQVFKSYWCHQWVRFQKWFSSILNLIESEQHSYMSQKESVLIQFGEKGSFQPSDIKVFNFSKVFNWCS